MYFYIYSCFCHTSERGFFISEEKLKDFSAMTVRNRADLSTARRIIQPVAVVFLVRPLCACVFV